MSVRCCGVAMTQQKGLVLDDDHAIYMQKIINKGVSVEPLWAYKQKNQETL